MLSDKDLIEFFSAKANRVMCDNFLSADALNRTVTGSSVITPRLFETILQTGILQGSTARVNYNSNYFNPHFSTTLFRLNMDSISDAFMYVGFKASLAAPSFDMTESHAGLVLHNGSLYFSTGNESGVSAGYINTNLSGIDLTKDNIFKIEYNKLSVMPMPQRFPYFGGFTKVEADRVWTQKALNSSFPPDDTMHYFVIYLKNLTSTNVALYFRKFAYIESYAD